MSSLENYQNNKLFILCSKLADLMILSVLWVVCSLPLVTIGASTAALYYSINKRFNLKIDGTASLFFHSFKDNLRQGIGLSVIYILFCGFIVFDITASVRGIADIKLPEWYKMFALVLILPVVFTVFYIFPYISRYSNTTKNCLINSFLLSAARMDHTFCLLLMNTVTLAGCVFFPPAALVLPGLCALLSTKIIEPAFQRAAEQGKKNDSSVQADDGSSADTDGGSDDDYDYGSDSFADSRPGIYSALGEDDDPDD